VIRSIRLLVRLRLRRLGHMLSAGLSAFKRQDSGASNGPRKAVAGKRTPSWLVAFLFAPLMLFSAFQLSLYALRNLARVSAAITDAPAMLEGLSALGAPGPVPFVVAATGLVSIVWLAYFLLNIAARGEFSAPQWDLAWLATLPIATGPLLIARIAERSVVHAVGYLLVFPALTMLAWHGGWRWAAPFIGAVAAIMLFLLGAALRTGVEAWLRLRVKQQVLRNLQAFVTIAGLAPMYVAMSLGTGGGRDPSFFVFDWLAATPEWFAWTPFGLATQAALATAPFEAAALLAALAVEVLASVAIIVGALQWVLRHGFVGGGLRESSRVATAPSVTRKPRSWLSPIQRKEILLLARDRTFLMQTLLVPIVVGVAQYLINPGAFVGALESPRALGAAVFGVGAYTLCFSALPTLNAEGQALWMLFAAPIRMDKVVIEKGLFWGSLVTFWPAAMAVTLLVAAGEITPSAWFVIALVAIGLPIYGVIASCLGVFACRPLEKDKMRRVQATWLYVFMLLSSLHTWAIFAESLWATSASLVLSCLLALALWQKATDRLPYLLDPTAAPASSVSLADGLIAAQAFFVVQGVVVLLVKLASEGEPIDINPILLAAFCSAAAVTWGLARLIYWRNGTAGVPGTFGRAKSGNIVATIGGGLAAATIGVAWLTLLKTTDLLPAAWHEVAQKASLPGWWMVPLAVLAAPVFEEFIFRGLVFGGLRRTFGAATSVLASGAIFGIVHPPASFVPVFAMGCVAAIVYERAGKLWAPMGVHAIYNGVIVGLPFVT